jgi:hypothetical protein
MKITMDNYEMSNEELTALALQNAIRSVTHLQPDFFRLLHHPISK